MRTDRIGVVALLAITGCMPSRSQLYGPVDATLQKQLGLRVTFAGTDPRVPAAIAERLRQPLDLEAAVEIAVANNRDLQVTLAEVGIAGADIASATVLRPMEIDLSYRVAVSGPGSEVEVTAVQDVLRFALGPPPP